MTAMVAASRWERFVSTAVSAGRRVHADDEVIIYQAPTRPTEMTPLRAQMKYATHERLGDLAWFHSARELRVFARFLDAGHIGYLGYIDDRCVHRTWLIPGPARVREHWSEEHGIGADEGFVHYCLTAAAARGCGVFPAVLAQVGADQAGRVIKMAIASDNRPSRHAASKAGWQPVEVVRFTVYLGIRRQLRRALIPKFES